MARAVSLSLPMRSVVGCGSSGEDGPALTGVSTSDDGGYHGVLLDQPYAAPDLPLTGTDNRPFDHTVDVISVAGGHRDPLWMDSTSQPDTAEDLEKILKADA